MLLPRPIAPAVDKVARQLLGNDWPLYAALLDHWREIVGEAYANKTTPVRVSFPQGKKEGEKWAQGAREGGTLHLRLPQGLAMEFSFLTDTIRQRITSFFGYEAVARIVFEATYGETDAPPARLSRDLTSDETRQLTEQVQTVENDELRTALENLGKAVMKGDPF